MINVLFKTLLKNIELDYGYTNVIINNKELYRKLYFTPFEELIISSNGEEVSSSKTLVINHLLDSDINDKKNITDLHKYLNKVINNNYFDDKCKMLNELQSFIDEVIDDQSTNIEYDVEIDYVKLLQAINLRYKVYDSILENIINYIKQVYSNKTSLIISFGLNNLLDKEEICILHNELEINQIILFNISTNVNDVNTKLIVDNDLCII